MIGEAEIRRLAAHAGVDPMVQDLDYCLGWFLAGFVLLQQEEGRFLLKGGTCLRKAYLADYRFSEVLDFTLTRAWPAQEIEAAIRALQAWSAQADGPDFAAQPLRIEVINDEYSHESLQARVYYRGPLRWNGPPRAIRLDLSRDEVVVFSSRNRALLHPYSDVGRLPLVALPCYAIEEMLGEKLRAIGGQRRYAMARDLYDIYRLIQLGVAQAAIRQALPAKFAVKGLIFSEPITRLMQERRASFEADWQRSLIHLLPLSKQPLFDVVWESVIQWLELPEGSKS